MARIERFRDVLTATPTAEYWRQRTDSGWRLMAVEWEREVAGEQAGRQETVEEIPYGLKIAEDCLRLEVNVTEREALMLMLELIVQDRSLSQVAVELNQRGFRTRRGAEWSPAGVFNMLPRMIEVGPRVFPQEEWAARRRQLFKVV
jgi:hypothetical protein